MTNGDCFSVAPDVAADLVVQHRSAAGIFVVHGLVWSPETDRHWHAWVEVEQMVDWPGINRQVKIITCVDRSNGNDASLPQALYYKLGHVTEVKRYTVNAALDMMLTHEHYGPWEGPVEEHP